MDRTDRQRSDWTGNLVLKRQEEGKLEKLLMLVGFVNLRSPQYDNVRLARKTWVVLACQSWVTARIHVFLCDKLREQTNLMHFDQEHRIGVLVWLVGGHQKK